MIRKIIIAGTLILFSASTFSQWAELFDGKTVTGWKKLAGDATFQVKDGAIVGTTVAWSPNTFLVTENKYDDFILELETRLDDPINSGVQFRSHFDAAANNGSGKVFGYQFDVDPTPRRWTGGIYDEGRREWLYPLDLNPAAQDAFKIGEYNKVRIECFGNTVRTWINGVLASWLVDTLMEKGFIGLQVHSVGAAHVGKNVYWKNIRIRKSNSLATIKHSDIFIVNLLPNKLSEAEKENGWKLLFDGKTTTGWIGAYKNIFPEKGWSVNNGMITVEPSAGGESTNGGDIVTIDKYSAFDFSFEFRLTPGANSGVKYFVTLSEGNTGSAIGLEYQLLDDKMHPDAKMGRDGNRTLASLYDLIPANKQERFVKPPGQWNRGRIVVHPDNKVEHFLNGVKVLEYKRGSPEYRDLVAISKYAIWKNFGEAPEGRILLQDHGNEVNFRSLKVRVLK